MLRNESSWLQVWVLGPWDVVIVEDRERDLWAEREK
jgi:hypothetical protein